MEESGRSRLKRHSVTAFFVGCSIGVCSIITGIVTGEQNRFIISGLLIFISTVVLTAGVASLTSKNYLRIDPKTRQIALISGRRWAMAILWIIGGIFFLFLAGMYYRGEDPLNIPKKQTEQRRDGDPEEFL
jgi:threonine/homoserine/homoserine lactone efflux protein